MVGAGRVATDSYSAKYLAVFVIKCQTASENDEAPDLLAN